MNPPSPETLLGRTLKDMYGRYVGVVAGISMDDLGGITSVIVDQGHDGFTEIDIDRLSFEDGGFTLIPEWRLKADGISGMMNLTKKKLQALDDLYREGEISQLAYEQLASSYNEQLDRYQEECEESACKLKDKVTDIEWENKALEEFLGRLKLQHKLGGVDDSILQATKEYVIFMLERNGREARDIASILEVLTSPEQPSTNPEETVEVPSIQDSTPTEEIGGAQRSETVEASV